jgi:radical SAM superfamily enzyme YgiQ (UPF0313 family)
MLPKTESPRTALLSAETGTIKKDWRGKISVALTYPNTYHVGMSNLGFQTVYRLINGLENVVCERAFLPEGAGRAHGRLRSLESGRRLADFDIIAFSISFENDYPNLLTILALAGLPLLSSERQTPHALIIAGGATSLLNPEPIALFVDCFLIGEAEPILPRFFEVYEKHSQREVVLEALAKGVPGAYIPALYQVTYESDGTLAAFRPKGDFPAKVKRVIAKDLSLWNTCTTVLTPHTTFDDTYLIEAARGCPHGCRFCAAGFVYRPPRFRTTGQLENALDQAAGRARGVGLMAAAVSDVPGLESLCRKAIERDLQLSFSSFRADLLTSSFLDILKQARIKTATIAPDAGSERMRRVINKGISEEDILRATEWLVGAGIPNLKVYFMIGLPGETMLDVESIVALCKRIKHRFLKASRAMSRLGQIIVSMSSFVPKPFTPFQWVPLEDLKSLKAKIKHVKDGLRCFRAGIGVRPSCLWVCTKTMATGSRHSRARSSILIFMFIGNGPWMKFSPGIL